MKQGTPLFSIAEIKTLEQQFFSSGHTPLQLMEQAGQEAFWALQKAYPSARDIAVLCGPGFNGVDGLILALCAKKAGLAVSIYMLLDKTPKSPLKEIQEQCYSVGLTILPYHSLNVNCDIIVDALFGIGFRGKPEGLYEQAIAFLQKTKTPIISLDIPSGIDADTGNVPGIAVPATMTISFLGHKRGLFTGAALDYVGKLVLKTLGAERYYHALEPACFLLDAHHVASLPKRKRNSHKGNYGFVTVIGGDLGYGGALSLAGGAALVSGAGVVQLLTHPHYQAAFLAARPECVISTVQTGESCTSLLTRTTVIVVGPGLGSSAWSKSLWDQIEEQNLPAVIDADGLNLLAESPQSRDQWILTPHPKEAARLLESTVEVICQDRFNAVLKLQKRYGGVIVLKGAGTLITDGQMIWVCAQGNPGMATAGSGDVLAGLIGGLLAQGLSCIGAATRGVLVHAQAGDSAAQKGERGLCAQDILAHIREYNQN